MCVLQSFPPSPSPFTEGRVRGSCVCVCLGMGVGVEEKYPGMRIFNDKPEIRLVLLTTVVVY